MRLFLDTSYALALQLGRDQHHASVKADWSELTKDVAPSIVTTTFVFDEIVTFFNSRGFHQKAVEIGKQLLSSGSTEVVEVDSTLLEAGWKYFCDHGDKTYSLTDCISFVVMESKFLQVALSTDHHFQQAGFQVRPFG